MEQPRHLLLVQVAKPFSSVGGSEASIAKTMDLICLWTIKLQFDEATADSVLSLGWLFLNVCHHLFSKQEQRIQHKSIPMTRKLTYSAALRIRVALGVNGMNVRVR